MFRPRDTFGIPLGPGHPSSLLHALGERDDWEHLDIFGALLLDLYPLFSRPGRPLRQRLLRAGRARPRRQRRPHRVRARRLPPVRDRSPSSSHRASSRPARRQPDADGWMSLSLHAGATVREMQRAAEDPDRLLIVEANPHLPRTFGTPARARAPCARGRGRRDRRGRPAAVPARRSAAVGGRAGDRGARRDLRPRRLHAADGHRRDPVDDRLVARRSATAATTACTRRCSRPASWQLHRAGKVTQPAQGSVRRVLRVHLRARHAGAVRVARRQRGRPLPAGRRGERAARGRGQPRHRLDQRRDRRRPLRAGRRRPPRRPAVLRASAATRTSSRCPGSSSRTGHWCASRQPRAPVPRVLSRIVADRARRARPSPAPATRSTSWSPSTASPSCAAAPCGSGPRRSAEIAHPDFRAELHAAAAARAAASARAPASERRAGDALLGRLADHDDRPHDEHRGDGAVEPVVVGGDGDR